MLLIPAIDIKGGKCVRLRQGDMQDVTVFSEDPVAMARHWLDHGARRLHIVDLDGASAGSPVNLELIQAMVETVPEVPVQLGGGIRDEETIDNYLNAGVQYIILGTKAVNDPHFVSDVCAGFPGHIIVGLDVKDGKLATDGWSKLSSHDVIDLACRFEEDGVTAFVFTDIGRDGMLEGVNVSATVKLAEAVRIPVIASGGVKNLDDIRRLCEVAESGIGGIITGRAVYAGTLDFAAGQKLADALCPGGDNLR